MLILDIVDSSSIREGGRPENPAAILRRLIEEKERMYRQ
jgi:hypothetical protein